MSMEPYSNDPIARQKTEVRSHARNGLILVGGGIGGGVALAILASSWSWLVLGLIVAVAGGVWSWTRIRKIVD